MVILYIVLGIILVPIALYGLIWGGAWVYAMVMLVVNYIKYFKFNHTNDMDYIQRKMEEEKTKGKRDNGSIFLEHLKNGRLNQAEFVLRTQLNKNLQAGYASYYSALLHMEEKNYEKAKEETEKVKNKRLQNSLLLKIALEEEDWNQYEMIYNKIASNKKTKLYSVYYMKANKAYKQGDYEKAQNYGDKAIELARGYTRYNFLESLERQKNNPTRTTYF